MVRNLHVWLLGHRVGELLQEDSGQLQFRYLDEWLALPNAVPFSISLPLQNEAFSQKLARPFFAGLLPEESNRSIIAAAFGVSKNNDFALLDRIGGECAGGVTLLPDGELEGVPETPLYHPMDEAALSNLFSELPNRPLLAGKKGLRLSLAGVRVDVFQHWGQVAYVRPLL